LLLDDQTQTFRVVKLERPFIMFILERIHVSPTSVTTREWAFKGERDQNGNRIFRETRKPKQEEPEHPVYDELNVKFPSPA
jgi:hypothetical protein